jgi:hypothetical protein
LDVSYDRDDPAFMGDENGKTLPSREGRAR